MVGFEAFGLPKGCQRVFLDFIIVTISFGWCRIVFEQGAPEVGTQAQSDVANMRQRHHKVRVSYVCPYKSHIDSFDHDSALIRFIPPLTVSAEEMDEGLHKVLMCTLTFA
jgi:hypothetical protein